MQAAELPLFASDSKYDHGTGWPSFTTAVEKNNIRSLSDLSLHMQRTEVRCAVCDGHLGHVFADGPAPTYQHYCINSAALDFNPEEKHCFDSQKSRRTFEIADSKIRASNLQSEAIGGLCCRLFLGRSKINSESCQACLATRVGYTGGQTKILPTSRSAVIQDRPRRGGGGPVRSQLGKLRRSCISLF